MFQVFMRCNYLHALFLQYRSSYNGMLQMEVHLLVGKCAHRRNLSELVPKTQASADIESHQRMIRQKRKLEQAHQ